MSTLPQPIGRLIFLARFVWFTVVLVFAEAIVMGAMMVASSFPTSPTDTILFILNIIIFYGIFIFLLMCIVRFAIIARLVSIGANRWWAVLIIVPLVNFIFLIWLLACPAGTKADVIPEPILE